MKNKVKVFGLLLFLFVSCSSSKIDDNNSEPACKEECEVNDPVRELPWLTEIIDGFVAAAYSYNPHARIYQCSYKCGIGFLLEMCVGCTDDKYSFRNCEGEILCISQALSGEDSCSELEIDHENKKLIWEVTEMHYPVEIPFTVCCCVENYPFGLKPPSLIPYPIADVACTWAELVKDKKGEIIVINSNEELDGYINCLDGDYPNIDFSKHTLLLANGITPKIISQLSIIQLLQLSVINYQLDIKIGLGDGDAPSHWVIALIVSKLNKKSNIKLIVIK